MIRALLMVFVSGATVMVSELVAGRLVAPSFGQSVHTWTALTGVTLLGCTLGNALGALASRRSPRLVASLAFALGALALAAAPFVLPLAAPLGLVPAVALAWLPPSVLLGCVTPSAAAAAVRPERNGSDLSLLYALSMAGSLLGAGLGGLLLPFVLPADTLYFILAALLLLALPLALTLPPPAAVQSDHPAQGTKHKAQGTIPAPALAVFALGYLGMAAEMAASKLVIPIFGGNHIVWALIIVSFIGWMALGGSLGGRLADRFPSRWTSVLAVCAAALGLVGTLALETLYFTRPGFDALDVPLRLFLQIVLGFAPAALTLGLASTAILKFATAGALAAGDRAAPGLYYALSSVGAVAGTFVTGLWCTGLVPGFVLMGLLAAAAALVALRLAWSDPDQRALAFGVLVAVVIGSACARRPVPHDIAMSDERILFSRESNYNVVSVTAEPHHPSRRTIWLDRIGHTSVDLENPNCLMACYTIMIDAAVSTLFPSNAPARPSIFMIGGGGYALPLKWSLEQSPPEKVVVAEIDPLVKAAAFAYLKPPNHAYPAAWSFPVGDGRSLAAQMEKGSCDIVIGDTIADTAIPYHLVTAEFTAQLKSLLKPDGVYLLHTLDIPENPELAATLAATLRTCFAHVGGFHYNGLLDKRQSIILVATDDPTRLRLDDFAAATRRLNHHAYPHTLDLQSPPPGIQPLTDRFAPVERWVWRTITSSMETRATELARVAREAARANDWSRAVDLALQALAIDPDHVWAVEALADYLEFAPDPSAPDSSPAQGTRHKAQGTPPPAPGTRHKAQQALARAAARENPDPYAKRRLEALRKAR